jgi:hypothetical protein
MKLDEDKLYIKIVALHAIYKFITVKKFRNYLEFQNIILNSQFKI